MSKLLVNVDGPEAGPDLVLLHGWGMGRVIWQPLQAHLTPTYRVHWLDLPGYGDNAEVAAKTLDEIADAVMAVVPAGAHWLGWSLGGMVALRAASRGARLSRLSLVASSPRFVQAPDWPCAMQESDLQRFAAGLGEDLEGTLARFIALQFYGVADSREQVRALQRAVAGRRVAAQALANGLEMLRMEDLRDEFERVQVPLDLVLGSIDRLVPVAVAEALLRMHPQLRVQSMRGAGHAPFVSHAAEFMQRLGL